MQSDSELLFHGSDDLIFKVNDFLRGCLSGSIDNDQRLLLIDSCIAAGASFPSALLNQPCGRYFYSLICHIVRNFCPFGDSFDIGEYLFRNYGILEKAARTSDF